jgi:hypothetical protein
MAVPVRLIAFAVGAVCVVAVLWFVFKPHRPDLPALSGAAPAAVGSPGAPAASAGTPAAASAGATPGDGVFELVVRNGRLVSGPALIQVHEGQRVILRITSDATDELHLHGYDLHARIRPQETASLEFSANRTGRFGLELHKAHTELGALEVYPR